MDSYLNIMKCLGCKLGHFSGTYAFQADSSRIKGAEVKSRTSTLQSRMARRMKKKKAMHEYFVAIERPTYEEGRGHFKCKINIIAAALLDKLMQGYQTALRLEVSKTYYWSDNMICCHG
ncbi:hypothetical protein NPIL_633991 [Nephila pilipes]|uniref:Uncharacterized protein n=1 Tax=Nephila pilipes TaxID=299642 RepID=A0A8X6I6I9_NEPPI|nr:hypothetical protein NPIL_508021 [Nephila pilipes]GFT92934.1 hypothetical protein NPIL_633991 [Nephila pilipes]